MGANIQKIFRCSGAVALQDCINDIVHYDKQAVRIGH